VSEEHVQSEWDRIFGKKKPSKSQQKRVEIQSGSREEEDAKSYRSNSKR
jgi:hypothetical protein